MANSDVTTFSQLQGALETVKDYIDTAGETVTNRVVQAENDITTLQTNTYTKTETDALIADIDTGGLSYLPLTGGTLSGDINIEKASGQSLVGVTRTDTGTVVRLVIDSDGYNRGLAQIDANGTSSWIVCQTQSNNVYLRARDESTATNLILTPSGSLTCAGDEVVRVAKESFGSSTSGNLGYVKFTNGLLIQWCGSSGSTSGTTVTWPTAWSGYYTYRAVVTRQSEAATDVTNIYNYQHQTTTTGLIFSSSSTAAVSVIGIGY